MNRLRRALQGYRVLLLPVAGAVFLNFPLLFVLFWRNQQGAVLTPLKALYLTGVTLGYYLLPMVLLFVVLGLLTIFSRRAATALAGTLLGFFAFYMLADSTVYSIYKFHIDFFWLDFVLHNAVGMGISPAMILAATGILILIIALEFGVLWLTQRYLRRARWVWSLVVASLVLFTVSQVLHIIAYEKDDSRITALTPGLPFYLPFTSHKHAARYGGNLPLFAADRNAGESPEQASGHGTFHYPLHPVQLTAMAEDSLPNILFLVLESWRSDEMNQSVSPRIWDLGTRSTVGLNHFSTGNSTVAGIFGMFYGIQPTYWTEVKAKSELIDNPVLIDILEDRGYELGIYAKSRFGRHKIKDTVFRGIEVHKDFAGATFAEQDRDLTDQLLGFIDRQHAAKKPFMALAFFKASHFSFSFDEEHAVFQPAKKVNLALADRITDMTPYLNYYRNSLFFDDDMIGRILDDLQVKGLMDNTIIIVTSDHGEEFNDNGDGYWGHGSNFTRYQTQVPFVMYLPGQSPRRISSLTSHLDIVPTLLKNFLGCANPIEDYSDGLDLLSSLPPVRPLIIASYFNHAVILGDDVFASCPMQVRKYKLSDTTQKAGPPTLSLMKSVMANMVRFYGPANTVTAAPGPATDQANVPVN